MLCEMRDIGEGLSECVRCGKPAKRAARSFYRKCALPAPAGTAGTQLKRLLATFGISAEDNCKCSSRATHMNRMGDDWCEQNIETIVGWLEEEAKARRIPFIRSLGRMVVRKAIKRSRKESGD